MINSFIDLSIIEVLDIIKTSSLSNEDNGESQLEFLMEKLSNDKREELDIRL